MLINSRRTAYRRWTTCLVLLTALTLASCGQKAEENTATSTPNQTESQVTPASTSTTAAKDSTKTTSSKSTTLSAEAQKLGVKPTGTDCPANAPIKGNINKKGNKIFHEAKSKNYKEVKPEICFADVATAQKAGFKSGKPGKKE